jgi:hypothetical protein
LVERPGKRAGVALIHGPVAPLGERLEAPELVAEIERASGDDGEQHEIVERHLHGIASIGRGGSTGT